MRLNYSTHTYKVDKKPRKFSKPKAMLGRAGYTEGGPSNFASPNQQVPHAGKGQREGRALTTKEQIGRAVQNALKAGREKPRSAQQQQQNGSERHSDNKPWRSREFHQMKHQSLGQPGHGAARPKGIHHGARSNNSGAAGKQFSSAFIQPARGRGAGAAPRWNPPVPTRGSTTMGACAL